MICVCAEGFEGVLRGEYTLVERNDELFWKTKNVDFDFDVDKVEIKLENLFNGDRALGTYIGRLGNMSTTDQHRHLNTTHLIFQATI